MNIIKQSFPPLINKDSKLLILGTLPGEDSLKLQQYYGHIRNQFWRLLGDTIHMLLVDKSYPQKCEILLKNHIALWDTLQQATRKGSLDSNIRTPTYNDISALLEQFPNIQHIAFNGQQARHFFKQHEKTLAKQIELYNLPSSSPAYTLAYEKKLIIWKTNITKALALIDI